MTSTSSRLLQVLTLRCEAASLLSSRELDDPLPFLDRAALLCHVAVCRSCRRFRTQVRLIRTTILRREQILEETVPRGEGLSPEARERIARACQRFDCDASGGQSQIE